MRALVLVVGVFKLVHAATIVQPFSQIAHTQVMGAKISGTPLTTHATQSWARCVALCVNDTSCFSVNLEPATRICHLMASRVATQSELQSVAGWEHLCELQR